MKKLFIVISVIVLSFLITSCTSDATVEHYEYQGTTEIITQVNEQSHNQEQNITMLHQHDITIEDLVYDLEYLFYVLKNNFIFFRSDNNMLDEIKNQILSLEYVSLNAFANILIDNASYLSYNRRLVWNIPLEYRNYYLLEAETNRERIFFSLTTDQEQYDTFIRTTYLNFGQEFANEVSFAINNNDMEHYLELLSDIINDFDAQEPITASIIEPNIAYLTINRNIISPNEWLEVQEKIFSFYEEIKYFDHLIIDLQHVRLPHWRSIMYYMIAPLISDTLQATANIFMLDGEYSMGFAYPVIRRNVVNGLIYSTDRELYAIDEYLTQRHVSMPDIQNISYAFEGSTFLLPRTLERFDNQAAFNGKIWLLTSDIISTSLSQQLAWVLKDTETATLVGETTQGIFGNPGISHLPNTGFEFFFDTFYITNHTGDSLANGITPHHFNLPNMTALETALLLIKQ